MVLVLDWPVESDALPLPCSKTGFERERVRCLASQTTNIRNRVEVYGIDDLYHLTYPQAFEVEKSWFVLLRFNMIETTLSTRGESTVTMVKILTYPELKYYRFETHHQ